MAVSFLVPSGVHVLLALDLDKAMSQPWRRFKVWPTAFEPAEFPPREDFAASVEQIGGGHWT